MLLDIIVKPLASFSYNRVLKREKQLGYKILLNQDVNKWIAGTMIFDMTPVWKKYGYNAVGVNYFTIGKVVDSISSRFDSTSPYYQAWLGGYIVRFPESRKWSIEDHFYLGEIDQKNWLSIYGVRKPFVKIDLNRIKNLGEFRLGKYRGSLYQGGGKSNTDVGNNINRLYLSILWSGGSYCINKNNPQSQVSYTNFIPDWTKKKRLHTYQVIDLEGFVAILEIDNKTKAILYVNGCNFIDINKKKTDTFKRLKTEFLDDLKRFRIKTVS